MLVFTSLLNFILLTIVVILFTLPLVLLDFKAEIEAVVFWAGLEMGLFHFVTRYSIDATANTQSY